MSATAKGKTLVIVESPSKAKTIEKYLGKDFVVRASVGHIRDIPASKKCRKCKKPSVDTENDFAPHYEITEGKENVVAELRSLARSAKNVLLATDPDREGEAIAWHIATALDLKKAERIVFHEITETAIKEALTHPRTIDMDLKSAQEARRILDRLVGYDLSGLIWKAVRFGLGAGRVQSPALRILMEREREIRKFVPETFWRLFVNTTTAEGGSLLLECTEEPRDKEAVDRIVRLGHSYPWSVLSVKETEALRSPRPPFTTSTLQQSASTRLGMSPSRTMQVAQKLYEAGHISYMRTDSTNLSKEAQRDILKTIANNFGEQFALARTYKTKSKNAQEAHEAVRPTNVAKKSVGATDEQRALYRLIWARTVASQMIDAKTLRTKILANVMGANETMPDFQANGSRLLERGWLLADPDAEGEEVAMPKVTPGEPLKLGDLTAEEKQTEPPPRYTEAGLIKELEKRDIGRPSTYASIIRTLLAHAYVEKSGRALIPTDTGDVVSSFLEAHFPTYISDTFTAEMEQELDDIANGKRKYAKVLGDFYGPFHKDVLAKEGMEKLTNLGDAPEEMLCPTCNGKMVIKLGKNGRFYSCARFPECLGARNLEGKELEGPKTIGEKCPDCGNGDLMEREGRFGRFIACSNYPKCKYIKKDANLNPVVSSGVKCNVCNVGDMIERRGRFGIFWSCSNYPACKHAIKAKPTGNLCPTCNSLMMLGTKTIPERCSKKECHNHNPHKLDKTKK